MCTAGASQRKVRAGNPVVQRHAAQPKIAELKENGEREIRLMTSAKAKVDRLGNFKGA
jgi:hypothetical protein